MVLLVVSSTVGYKKSSLRKCATYGQDFIVKENNRKLETNVSVSKSTSLKQYENNRVLGLSHVKVS
jgi:hypothetical protein